MLRAYVFSVGRRRTGGDGGGGNGKCMYIKKFSLFLCMLTYRCMYAVSNHFVEKAKQWLSLCEGRSRLRRKINVLSKFKKLQLGLWDKRLVSFFSEKETECGPAMPKLGWKIGGQNFSRRQTIPPPAVLRNSVKPSFPSGWRSSLGESLATFFLHPQFYDVLYAGELVVTSVAFSPNR